MNNHKSLKAQASNHEQLATENRVFQELREIKNEIREVKKFLIINSIRHLVNNYEKITQAKQEKLAKDWENWLKKTKLEKKKLRNGTKFKSKTKPK